MDKLKSSEIGGRVDYINWLDFSEHGFVPLVNLLHNVHGDDQQMAREAYAEYKSIVEEYGPDNVAYGAAFALEEDGSPVFAYLDGSPLFGVFVRHE